MNIKKLKFLCVTILCINMLQLPTQANIKNEDTTFCPDILPGMYLAAGLYFGYNYLIREEFLVKNKFPIAQIWYEELTEKYPEAHLNHKQFIQKPNSGILYNKLTEFAERCSWLSNHNHIYFSDNDLGEITILYQKVLDGYPLHESEQLSLSKQEFILLHEAGHIEHDDAKDLLITMFGLFTAVKGIEFIINDTTQPSIIKREAPEDYTFFSFCPLKDMTTIPGIVTTYQGVTFMAGLIAMIRYQESRADAFACRLADDKTLQGAIDIFEDEDMDSLYDIENKQITPYIANDSIVGKTVQTIVGPVEFIINAAFYQMLLFTKSIPEARWIYDFKEDAIHQGPSIRAKLIQDELAIREQNKQK